jgi:uncharacterized phage-like protein YoqJ
MRIAVTGHRPNKLGHEYGHRGPYSDAIRAYFKKQAIELGCEVGISGMALGVDMIWAVVMIELKLPLIAAIPFTGQELAWPKQSQMVYHAILSYPKCTKVIVCSGGYSPQKMQVRNEWMVDHSDKLIGIWDGTSGGTGNCINYARSRGIELIIQNPNQLL